MGFRYGDTSKITNYERDNRAYIWEKLETRFSFICVPTENGVGTG